MSFLLLLHTGVLLILGGNLVYFARRRGDRAPLPDAPPRLSVLVPARNEEDNLERLIPSLLFQDYPDAEFIVVDDASTDGTRAVLERFAVRDERLVVVAGSGPPPGWVGKVHALYQATRRASGQTYLFLDADAALTDPAALRRLAERFAACGPNAALTGLPRYLDRGGAAVLTSLVPFAILAALPLPLVPRTRAPGLGALNGQVWMIGADDYRRLEPHAAHPGEVLEDVMIGRFLKRQGMRLHLIDLSGELAVRMYGSFGEAWQGFRKNAYLLAGGGRVLPFLLFFALYTAVWVVAPWMGWPLLATTYAVKGIIDAWGRMPPWVTLLAPVSLALGALLQLDSALAHARGTVAWKGRRVGARRD
ncbi:MAG: glycosyltransferase [Rubricoccaceae bacterium]